MEESSISVFVCREEKLVFGLSKRTTCAEVVRALLEEQDARSYCIVEKWRGFERILPGATKILRLWLAWGEEQRNVRFVLVKGEASLDSHAARSAEARVVLSKHGPCVTESALRAPASHISPEKRRRAVRKAFRKLEKMRSRKEARAAHRDAERMETAAHVVISQDHTLRQQLERIAELDAEIERHEARVHFDRVQRHGVNYVQDTYLVDAGAASGPEEEETGAELEEYARHCEEVLRLQEELREQEALIDRITTEVQGELNRCWMQRRREEQVLDGDSLAAQLDASLFMGLRLSSELEATRNDLELSREMCAVREKEMRDLLEKVNSLDVEERTAGGEGGDEMRVVDTLEQARGQSKAHTASDDDSDTGLSSLHSQDSDSIPVVESLV